ncbi:ABC transporter substrate-binding protein [Elioraea sp.]|uniref:ABC transporter substrate-binding protein n=1 Tax=Elioraea sp. TaxID=2185103 RepID=UPI0025BF37BA|nr:ABC transporter substrate-binding protein [Elioraea sp.]
MSAKPTTVNRRTLLGTAAAAGTLPLITPLRAPRAQAANTIKIGVLSDLSSLYTDLAGQGSVLAARMAVEDFNPGPKGFNVEIVAADHQNRADVGSTTARAWYDRDGVDAIVDVPNSGVVLAVNQITREKNKVMIVSAGATTDLTGPQCTPNSVHWTYDTFSQPAGTGRAMVAAGGDTWFFITADYAFGHSLEANTERFVIASGGRVVGKVRHPFPGTDFSSFLLQAQGSRAKVIGLANAGGDFINAMKQAGEFGIVRRGQKLAGLLVFITDVHSLGLETAQGLTLTTAFYHDRNDESRAFNEKFHPRNRGIRPTMAHAGVYGGVLHYLKAVEALGVAAAKADGAAAVAAMKRLPTNDPLFGQGEIRQDGRKTHPMYLYEVKAPNESRGPWDYLKLVREIPVADAWRPLADGNCPLVRT